MVTCGILSAFPEVYYILIALQEIFREIIYEIAK
jgi:hypothetical protein